MVAHLVAVAAFGLKEGRWPNSTCKLMLQQEKRIGELEGLVEFHEHCTVSRNQ